MLALAGFAIWAWLFGPRRRGVNVAGGAKGMGWTWPLMRGADGGGAPVLAALTRLDAHHSVAVLRWRNRELLIGLGSQSAPVVLDRRDLPEVGESA